MSSALRGLRSLVALWVFPGLVQAAETNKHGLFVPDETVDSFEECAGVCEKHGLHRLTCFREGEFYAEGVPDAVRSAGIRAAKQEEFDKWRYVYLGFSTTTEQDASWAVEGCSNEDSVFFSKWAAGEPNNEGGHEEFCAAIVNIDHSFSQWYDTPCCSLEGARCLCVDAEVHPQTNPAALESTKAFTCGQLNWLGIILVFVLIPGAFCAAVICHCYYGSQAKQQAQRRAQAQAQAAAAGNQVVIGAQNVAMGYPTPAGGYPAPAGGNPTPAAGYPR